MHAFFADLNSFDSHLKFTMDIGGSSLHILDLLITIDQNKLETPVYSKPTDAHLYLNADSCHPKSQIRGIAKGVALYDYVEYVLRMRILKPKVMNMPVI